MSMGGTATITVPAAEWAAMQAQLAEVRTEVAKFKAYMRKRRELAVIEFGWIEKLEDLPRTKESQHR